MAATVKTRVSVPNFKVGVADITLDSSYPTGGYALSPSAFGFSSWIESAMTQAVGGFEFEFDFVNQKLKVYRVNTTGAALGEVPAATDLHTVTVRITAFGY